MSPTHETHKQSCGCVEHVIEDEVCGYTDGVYRWVIRCAKHEHAFISDKAATLRRSGFADKAERIEKYGDLEEYIRVDQLTESLRHSYLSLPSAAQTYREMRSSRAGSDRRG